MSSAGEFHPCALPKPDVNVSAHPAPIIQPTDRPQISNEEITRVPPEIFDEASVWPVSGVDTVCMSVAPIARGDGSATETQNQVPIYSIVHSS